MKNMRKRIKDVRKIYEDPKWRAGISTALTALVGISLACLGDWSIQQKYFVLKIVDASHLLANSLKEEQQKIKDAFVECKRRQNVLTSQIEIAQRRQEKSHGEQRYRLSKEIGDLCKIHQNISKWKSFIGSLNTKYNEHVTSQNMKTAKYRDYIAESFGTKGQRWKERCHQRALARK
jgi:hypothetical protein